MLRGTFIMRNDDQLGKVRKDFEAPVFKAWGTVWDLTRVGATSVGLDEWPGADKPEHFEPGSNCKPPEQSC